MDGAAFLPEFDHEFAQTRKTLERVAEKHYDWKPHEKSTSLRDLAVHLSDIPGWVPVTMNTEEMNFDTAAFEPFVPGSTQELLERFDAAVAEAREALATASPEELQDSWTLKADGHVLFTLPKAAVLRSFVFNHNVHHRAQLGVYLRLLDIPVPAIYGPSADEQG